MSGLFERSVSRLRTEAQFAADKPDETPESTARALWLAAAGAPRSVTSVTIPLPELSAAQARALENLVTRRLDGQPLAYLIGRQEFMGREFLTAPGALIPRRETELLGYAVVQLLRTRTAGAQPVRMLDLCTGSGNLAVALALEEPRSLVWASDLEAAAIAVARLNVDHHGVADRVMLVEGDLFGAIERLNPPPGPFDLISCNPPYIPSHKATNMPVEVGGFEPVAAFDGGDFGLSILFRLISEASAFLVPGGWLCFELGVGQERLITKRLTAQGRYAEVRAVHDSHGAARALLARTHCAE